ncbi:phytanoyl-CoA dioxygenase family protein [Chitinimonas sp. BJB300]|uniref:phytanoyl-CoA dioxygenase family protein n=1 Tax=Chitinimonas sp. BJB300 TaxID=1559339 RepID=UPI000C112574|nr:phytanoyl-CoA dioxygenase family protein [Chitinimonas sp. BJB300]PHV13111.1 phytanoyl-CoA dioxygenase [Chitinimonas sp. BJB300]TSJ84708.1 phytanoyl-CoA dioxygenase family protein [Chitinimonas sp. BJB300]
MSLASFTPAEVASFQQHGFFIARGLADTALCQRILAAGQAQLAQAREPIEYEADTRYPGAPASRDAAGGRTARRLLQVFERDAAFRDWALSAPLAGRLKQLLAGEQVALSQAHHNSLMTKQPAFSSVTHWHRDIRYWNFANNNLVSVWLALGKEHRENGCLGFLPGTHKMDMDVDRFENRAFLRPDLPENQALIETAVFPELEAGDVVFFHAMTFHAAGWNRVDQTKYSLVFTYHLQDNLAQPGSRSASLPSIPVA